MFRLVARREPRPTSDVVPSAQPTGWRRFIDAIARVAPLRPGRSREPVRGDHDVSALARAVGRRLGIRGDESEHIVGIVSVCDAYHAMTSDRPSSPPLRMTEAIKELKRRATEFDPTVVEALCIELAQSGRPASETALLAATLR